MATLGTQQDFGTDVSAFPDLDPSFATISGNRVLIEICIRRWTTPRGSAPDAPDAGIDVRDYLNEGMVGLAGNAGNAVLSTMKQAMENEAKRDQRIRNCAALLVYNQGTSAINATVTLDGGNGPFTLELAISAVTIALLKTG